MARYICQLRRGTTDEWNQYESSKFIQTNVYKEDTEYYLDSKGTIPDQQPTSQLEVENGNYFIKNPDYLAPLEGELVLEYTASGIPRLKIGNGVDDYSKLPYMSVDSFVAPKPTYLSLYKDNWEETFGGDHFQDVTDQLSGKVTENSMINLQPTLNQLRYLRKEKVVLSTTNSNGKIKVYAIGEKPKHDYEDIQITITEVVIDE